PLWLKAVSAPPAPERAPPPREPKQHMHRGALRLGLAPRCDALFRKGGWLAEDPARAPAAPPGWREYCATIWSNPRGALRAQGLRLARGCLLEHAAGAGAVVVPANKGLVGPARPEFWMFASHAGGSVDELVHRAAGPDLLEACGRVPARGGIRCAVGSAVATPGTHLFLPRGHVIHAVAPVWHAAETTGPALVSAWRAAFAEAGRLGAASLACPALGCGTNGTPLRLGAQCCFLAWRGMRGAGLDVTVVLATFEAWQAWTDVAFFERGRGLSAARGSEPQGGG
ncbi:unnamed protein product, partial [Prorocentrum cordatum]